MFKSKLVVSGLLTVVITGSTAVAAMASTLHGGTLAAAVPTALAPASTDVYVELDRGGGQGAALAALSATYRAHPGTSQALAQLRSAMGIATLRQLDTVSASVGDRVGVAVWMPPAALPNAQPKVAIIAQLKPASLLSLARGGNPLQGLVTFSAPTPYHGATIYRVAFTGGGSGYGAVISGDGVLATDLITIERVVDTATFRAPSLATDAGYLTTSAQLPIARLLTAYVSAGYLRRAAQSAGASSGAVGQGTKAISGALQHPYGLAVVAQPGGVALVSSHVTVGSDTLLQPTPNRAATVVGNNAILYTSLDNISGMLTASHVLTPKLLAQARAQTGIDVAGDVLPLLSHEVALDVNGETSPLLQQIIASANQTSSHRAVPSLPSIPSIIRSPLRLLSAHGGRHTSAAPVIPGSLEIVTQVVDPAAAQQKLKRIAAALLHASTRSDTGGAPAVTPVTLPDGSTGYALTVLPGLEYTFRGNLLILSTSLPADVRAAQTPLSAYPAYQNALAHVAGPGPLVNVQYISVTRLLSLVNRIIAVTGTGGSMSPAAGTMSLQQMEALITPFTTISLATRQVAPHAEQVRAFISIQ